MRFLAIWIVFCLVFFYATGGFDYDSTDNAAAGERSGMVLYTDHLTGCQYVAPMFGGMTPRLDKDGNQVGCK